MLRLLFDFCWKVVGWPQLESTRKNFHISTRHNQRITFVHKSMWVKLYHYLKKIPVIVVLIGIRFGAGSPWLSQTSGFCYAHLLISKDNSSWTVCLSVFMVREFRHLIDTFELINTSTAVDNF